MAVKKTQQRVKCGYLVTPVGKALWVSAPNPSPYDDSKTEATVVLDAASAELFKKDLKAKCADAAKTLGIDIDEAIANYLKPNTDAEGNPTGEFRVKAKTGLQYMPSFADANGKSFKPESGFMIPHGSDIRLSIGFEVQVVKPTFKGIVARLRGIQIINLQDNGAGFDAVDGGFSAESTAGSFAAGASNDGGWGEGSESDSGW